MNGWYCTTSTPVSHRMTGVSHFHTISFCLKRGWLGSQQRKQKNRRREKDLQTTKIGDEGAAVALCQKVEIARASPLHLSRDHVRGFIRSGLQIDHVRRRGGWAELWLISVV